jgi:hypothetical protein
MRQREDEGHDDDERRQRDGRDRQFPQRRPPSASQVIAPPAIQT